MSLDRAGMQEALDGSVAKEIIMNMIDIRQDTVQMLERRRLQPRSQGSTGYRGDTSPGEEKRLTPPGPGSQASRASAPAIGRDAWSLVGWYFYQPHHDPIEWAKEILVVVL